MKSKNQGYVCYSANEINKSVLDSIEVGDLVKVNNCTKPMRVKFVAENGFAMTQKFFGDTYYSIAMTMKSCMSLKIPKRLRLISVLSATEKPTCRCEKV